MLLLESGYVDVFAIHNTKGNLIIVLSHADGQVGAVSAMKIEHRFKPCASQNVSVNYQHRAVKMVESLQPSGGPQRMFFSQVIQADPKGLSITEVVRNRFRQIVGRQAYIPDTGPF